MKLIYNDFIPFKGFKAINLFGLVFVRNGSSPFTQTDKNHEGTHTLQLLEVVGAALVLWLTLNAIFSISAWWLVGVVFSYYILYLLLWVAKGFSYRKNPFEQEAYAHERETRVQKEAAAIRLVPVCLRIMVSGCFSRAYLSEYSVHYYSTGRLR